MNFCGTKNNRKEKHDASNNAPQKMDSANPSTTKLNGKSPSNKNGKLNGASTGSTATDDIRGSLPADPYKWSEEEVAQWIGHIGYAQYADVFLQEHVNGEALLALTKDEFGQLGIYTLGHTKNILSKMAMLNKVAAKYKPMDAFVEENVNEHKSPYTFDQRDYWASHPEAYSQDKQRDKNTYWKLWETIVSHRDFMMEHDFKKLMSRSGLAKHDVEMIWKLSTTETHGRCGFDEFTSIMKLSHLAQMRVPLFIVNVSKLIFYHPPLASTEFFEFSAIFDELQKQQVLSNMVGFYNLPPHILDSDDRLMELEKKALRPYHPIHFEINAKVLIATFSNNISDDAIHELQKSVLATLREQMGFHGAKAQLLDHVYVQRPSLKELGMTPAGPGPGPAPSSSASAAATAAVNASMMAAANASANNGGVAVAVNGNGSGGGPSEINVLEMQRLLLLWSGDANGNQFWDEFRARTDVDKIVASNEEKIRTRQAMSMVAKLRGVSLKHVKFTDEGVKSIANKTKHELREQFGAPEFVAAKATILGLNETQIPPQLLMMQAPPPQAQAPAQAPRVNEAERYKGIVIEGLPDLITNDDENIRKLDSAVLNEFIVSHIEVVDNVLRITFANEVAHKNINSLRKYLKSFLKDDIKLDKKAMKNVSIIPHTRDTWKGETTERSVEVHNSAQYINVAMDSITATPQQQQQQQHNNYNYYHHHQHHHQ